MKYLIITVFVLMATIVISQIYVTRGTDKTKSVNYETIAIKEGFEIRRYDEQIVASTQLDSSSYSDISSQGFRKIASYIFGGNSSNQKIAMTSPVQMDMGSAPRMSFFMPNGMKSEDLPTPNREDVYLNIQPSKTVAVIEFTGWASDEVLTKKFNELKSKLDLELIQYENTYSYLGYNPPYQLFNRKNEIIIPLMSFEKN